MRSRIHDVGIAAVRRLRRGRGRQFASAMSGTVLGNVLGAALPFVIALWFKSGAITDAYFYALGAILFLNAVVSLAVESSATPYVVELKGNGPAAVVRFVRRVLVEGIVGTALLTVVASLVVVLAIVPILPFSGDQRDTIISTLVILGPLPALVTANAVIAGAHYGYGRFLLATSSVGLRSLSALAFGFALRGDLGIDSVAYGLVLGEALRSALLVVSLRRLLRVDAARFGLSDVAAPVSTRRFWGTVAPQVLAVSLGSVNLIVDKTVAAPLGLGRVTILELTQRLVYTPILLLTSGVGLVLGSTWAQLVQDPIRRRELRHDYMRTQAWVLVLSTALASAAIGTIWACQSVFSSAFDLGDPPLVATTFTLAAIGIPFALASQVAVRLLVAARQTGFFPALATVALFTNLALDITFARFFDVAGIALASACVNVLNALSYNAMALRLLSSSRYPVLLKPERART